MPNGRPRRSRCRASRIAPTCSRADWHAALADVEPAGPEDEETARALAEAFTRYLRAARADEHALSMLPPGRFLMPGDLEGSPALTFAPLDIARAMVRRAGTLAAMMERRYEAYKTHVVKPFFRDHFARLDRQIVLVDMLAALNAGPAAMRDLETALADVLAAFRPGRASWLHLHPDAPDRPHPLRRHQGRPRAPRDHDQLQALLSGSPAGRRAGRRGRCDVACRLAAVRATREGTVSRGGETLPAIAGVPMAGERVGGETFDGETEMAFFPGDLPSDPSIFSMPPRRRPARPSRRSASSASGRRGSKAPPTG